MRDGQERISEIEEIDDNHFLTSIDTPIRKDAFLIDDDIKIELIEKKFKDIMEILGLVTRFNNRSAEKICTAITFCYSFTL